MFLLDTDICIRILKQHPACLARYVQEGPTSVLLSSISYHELLYGALHSAAVQRHLAIVATFTAPLTILPFTAQSATKSSEIRQALAAAGRPIGPMDMLIAGHAIEHNLTLVTGNIGEFSRVPGLKLETWI